MNAETNSHLDDSERRWIIDSQVNDAISDGYFTSTGEYLDLDHDLEEKARMAYYDWCDRNGRPSIDYDDIECILQCSYHRNLTPTAIARLRELAAEFDYNLGDLNDEHHYFQADLFRKTPTYSFLPEPERDFVGQLATILNDPQSYCPSPD